MICQTQDMLLIKSYLPYLAVAPRAGAWIEIPPVVMVRNSAMVAPRAGAWIEMQKHIDNLKQIGSPLAQGRGLKLIHHHQNKS